MTRRLLFDQNLSPRLIDRLRSRFPDSAHVLTVGMSTASDAQVLEFAAGHDFVVVTKDKDSADLVTSRGGGGPQVLWVMLGNATTDEIAQAISSFADSILQLLDDPRVDIVQVTRPPHVGPRSG